MTTSQTGRAASRAGSAAACAAPRSSRATPGVRPASTPEVLAVERPCPDEDQRGHADQGRRITWCAGGRAKGRMRSVIMDCAVYRHGHRTEGPEDLSDALAEARAAGGFVWIGLYEPSEREFDLVTDEFGLHPLAVEDALKAHQRPKLEVYDDSLFMVLKPVVYEPDSDAVSAGEVMVFVGDCFVVTVRHGEGLAAGGGAAPAGGGAGDARQGPHRRAVRDRRRHRRPLSGGGDGAADGPGRAGGAGVPAGGRQFAHHRVPDLHLQAAGPGVPPGHRVAGAAAGPAGRQRPALVRCPSCTTRRGPSSGTWAIT